MEFPYQSTKGCADGGGVLKSRTYLYKTFVLVGGWKKIVIK